MPRPAATFPPSSFLARNATGLLKSRPTAADIAAQTPQKVQLLLTKGCDLHPSLQDPAVALRIKSGIVALANSESGPDRIVSQKCKAKSGRFFRAYVATADIQEGGSVLSLLAGTAVHASELESAPLLRGAIDQRSRNVDVCGVCLGATQLQETAGHPEHVVLLHDPNIRISSNDVRKNPMKNNDRGSDPNVAVVPFRTNAAAHGAVPMWTYGAAVVSLPGGMKKDARIAVDLGDARWDEMRRMRAMVAMARSDVTANTQELLCEVRETEWKRPQRTCHRAVGC